MSSPLNLEPKHQASTSSEYQPESFNWFQNLHRKAAVDFGIIFLAGMVGSAGA